jgi:hypothetical protein
MNKIRTHVMILRRSVARSFGKVTEVLHSDAQATAGNSKNLFNIHWPEDD